MKRTGKSRRPSITQLVARRNRAVRQRIEIKEHDAAIRQKAGLPDYLPDLRVDQSFPAGKPRYKIGESVGIVNIDGDTVELRETRREWWRRKHTEICDAHWAAERRAGIVEDEKRDDRLIQRVWDLDDEILATPARTPAEMLAKARVAAWWVVGDVCPMRMTVDDMLKTTNARAFDYGHNYAAFILLYRDLKRMLGKLPSPPLDLVVSD